MSDRLLSLGRLAAGVAHEVNNPLTHVLGNLQALRLKDGDPAERGVLLEDAIRGVQKVQGVMRDLQRFTRPRSE